MRTLLINAVVLLVFLLVEKSEGLCVDVKIKGLDKCCDDDPEACDLGVWGSPGKCNYEFRRKRCCASCYNTSKNYFKKHGQNYVLEGYKRGEPDCVGAEITGLEQCCDEDADACAGMVGAAPDDCNAANNRKFCCASCYNEDKDYFRQEGQNYVLKEDERQLSHCAPASVKVKGLSRCCDQDENYCSAIVFYAPDDCKVPGSRKKCCASCYEKNPNYFRQDGEDYVLEEEEEDNEAKEGDRKRQVRINALLKYLLQRKK